ncbi:DUF4153 domain-containing protein [Qipengyuania vesicularis]|uniref:DUF4153 domain-containing protein n=1 Tax=Qipengyuania vesicularis TaxID=2867232 RepID=UPI001C88B9F2|nr:DUF4153 domain-containing protein [Qipengyuania vesicularis]MBX7527528.1 DUF4153 domain-containing protein [Qipengyuania vesicularis]
MSQDPTAVPTAPDGEWSLRPWLLAGLLGVAGLLVHFASDWDYDDVQPWRAALTALVFFGPLAFAFSLDRDRWKEPLVFATLVGAVMAGIAWRVARAEDHYADEGYWFAAAIVSITLALPLFQAGFHKLRLRTSYEATHFHVWTDAICAAGALAFTGLSWLLAYLLSELFRAIGIDFLHELLEWEWFGWLFSGVTFGAALGVLRNQLKIIGTLQSVVMLVFSLIAVPFAVALVIFILAVLVSGLEVLWSATRSPTPLLLSCAAASFVLVNSVVRNGDEEASGNRVLRWAALVLALGILPLSIMAAVSTGTRIGEYGLSPERIWGLVAIIVAVAYGVAYFVAPIRGRMAHWMERVRRANLHLAVGTCVLALLLALPLLDFGAISTRDQLARLQSGKVPVDEFDFTALRWDFGDAGREALARLTKSDDPEIAKIARETQTQELRPYRGYRDTSREERLANIRFEFEDETLREHVRGSVRGNGWQCDKPCVALDLGADEDGRRKVAMVESGIVRNLSFDLGEAVDDSAVGSAAMEAILAAEAVETTPVQTAESQVEIREWTGRRIYIDGKPAGDPFE